MIQNTQYDAEISEFVDSYPIPIGGRLCSLCSSNL